MISYGENIFMQTKCNLGVDSSIEAYCIIKKCQYAKLKPGGNMSCFLHSEHNLTSPYVYEYVEFYFSKSMCDE